MKIIIVAAIYSTIAQILAYNWFRICKRKERGCRNFDCKKRKTCPYNELFTKDVNE